MLLLRETIFVHDSPYEYMLSPFAYYVRCVRMSTLISTCKACLNNVVRFLFGYDRLCSGSAIFMSEGSGHFDDIIRKAALQFTQRLVVVALLLLCQKVLAISMILSERRLYNLFSVAVFPRLVS